MALAKAFVLGRISNDLELKKTQSGTSVLSFAVACDRAFAKQGEEKKTDFISCVAWKQHAEFISKYFAKGRMIALEGEIQTRTFEDKNGSKHYVTEVVVDRVSFTGEAKKDNTADTQSAAPNAADADADVGDLSSFEDVSLAEFLGED